MHGENSVACPEETVASPCWNKDGGPFEENRGLDQQDDTQVQESASVKELDFISIQLLWLWFDGSNLVYRRKVFQPYIPNMNVGSMRLDVLVRDVNKSEV